MHSTAISIFLVLVVTTVTTTTSSAPISGLDTFLTRQSHIDPHSTNDSFTSLPSSLKSSLSAATPPPIPTLITSLLSLSFPISIHIRLVGPTSSFPPSTSPSLLLSYLSAAHSSSHFHVISPNPTTFSHSLSISHSPHFDISVSPSLATHLSQTLDSLLASTASSLRSPLLSIPYSSIDEIIKQDFEKEKPINGIYIYLLNLGSKGKNYAYSYSPGESSPGYTKCLGSIWTGKDRYLWIDLGAGPVDYGPALSGDGVLPKGEFHPLAAFHGRPKSQKALLADLASLVWSAYQVNGVTF